MPIYPTPVGYSFDGPQRYRCTKGHEWDQPAWQQPEALSFRDGESQQLFCMRCIRELLEQQAGTVEPVTIPEPDATVDRSSRETP